MLWLVDKKCGRKRELVVWSEFCKEWSRLHIGIKTSEMVKFYTFKILRLLLLGNNLEREPPEILT